MKKILLFALLCSTSASFALPIFAPPAKCPSAEAIIAEGLEKNRFVQLENGDWVVGQANNKYDTNDTWTFGFGFFTNKASIDDATFDRAKNALQSLHFVEGPILKDDNRWVCRYKTNDGYYGGAVYPHY